MRSYRTKDQALWFWRVQHLPRILATWGASLPPDRVHLVTVPPSGGPRDELWDRFADVLGLDPRASYAESETTNASLGGAEVTMLRRLNVALAEQKVPRAIYVNWVRETHRQGGPGRAAGQGARHRAAEATTAGRADHRDLAGGDPRAEVSTSSAPSTTSSRVARRRPAPWPNPDRADPDAVADAAIEALAHVLARAGQTPVTEAAHRGPPDPEAAQLMSLATTQGPSYDETVAGWADHLRSGGTTTWSAWLDDPRTGVPSHAPARRGPPRARAPAQPGGRGPAVLRPGRPRAGHRLARPRSRRRPAALARRAAALRLPRDRPRPAAGGGADPPRHRRARAPAARACRAPTAAPEPARWPVPWRRRFRLHGTPGTAAAVRRGLLEQGLVESDWRPTHVVIARPVEAMMAEHWAATGPRRGHPEVVGPVASRRGRRAPARRDRRRCDRRAPRRPTARAGPRRRRPGRTGGGRDDRPAARGAHVRGRRQRRPRRDRPDAPGQPADRCWSRAGPGPRPLLTAGGQPRRCTLASRPGTRSCRPERLVGLGPGTGHGGRARPPPRLATLCTAIPTSWFPPTPSETPAQVRHRRPHPHPRAGRRGLSPDLAPAGRYTVTRRVLLHVGAPKTGTSFVQDILFTNRDALRERGILYPADRHDAHFLAALDLMELPWGGLEHEAVGAWDRLAAEVRDWPGTAIISHEILGTASRVQVARALESLGVPRHRDPPRLLRPRPGPPDPRGVAGERQAPPHEDLRPLPGEPPRPRAQRRGGPVVLGRPGGARRARPLGRVAPPRARAPGHGAAARVRARPCCGSGSPACSASTRPSSPRRARPTPRSAYPSRR